MNLYLSEAMMSYIIRFGTLGNLVTAICGGCCWYREAVLNWGQLCHQETFDDGQGHPLVVTVRVEVTSGIQWTKASSAIHPATHGIDPQDQQCWAEKPWSS